MDKYEYKVRAEEIHKLIEEQDYAAAVEIADTIDWRRVKNINTLCTISDLYKINRRYQESKEILLMAYERHPDGRLIVYSLCELSIKLEEYVQAIEYYKEYVTIAPKDTSRYILQYRIYESQDVPFEERAEVLEEFKRKDYREKWAYELAYLYHRMGLARKCVDECDELIVTFGEGRYVAKALELKALHQPLSALEQAKYDRYFAPTEEEEVQPQPAVLNVSDVGASIDSQDIVSAPTTEIPAQEEIDIQVKTVDVGQYNTTNLQEALAESMKELLGEEETILEPKPSTPEEDAEDNTIFGTSPLAGAIYANNEEAFNVENWDNTGEINVATEPVVNTAQEAQKVEAYDIPISVGMTEYKTTHTGDDILTEETKRIPTEAVVDYLEAHRLKNEINIATASLVASDEQANNIPGAVTGEISLADVSSEFDQMLSQESDGQISLALPDSEQLEKQITGQLSIEDILAEWENTKKENEEKRRREVKQRILQHTGSLFDEFDEDTRADLLEQLEKVFRDAIDKEAKNGLDDSDELNERISKEARRAVEYLTRDGMLDDSEEEEGKLREDVQKAVEEAVEKATQEIEDTDDSDSADIENEEQTADIIEVEEKPEVTIELVEAEDTSEDSEEEYPDIADDEEEEVKAVMQALAEDDEDAKADNKSNLPGESEESEDEESNRERVLSDEEKDFFAPYLTYKSTRRQLAATLENMSLASYTGNIIVTGEEGVGTIDLIKRLVKHLQEQDSDFVGQIAKISGKALNNKDIAATVEQLRSGALIIENARGMKKSTVEKLMKALEKEDLGILIALEDTSEGIDRIIKALPKLETLFNARVDLHALDDKALVSYAREYALSQEFSIDEFGVLALHTRIEELQTSDHQVTVSEVRDLVDDAIYYAEKKTPAHFFDVIFRKRYDEDDMIILREKDFMHY